MALLRTTTAVELVGRRLVLRPLEATDFEQWTEVRQRAATWLRKWEPSIPAGHADPSSDRRAFVSRCAARDRERQLGSGYGFGMFFEGQLVGEINLSSIQRGPFQSCYVGYWVDEKHAGKGFTPEAVVMVMRFAFEELGLHRVQVAIIPRNDPSRRVMAKLGVREEGIATRYLEINGVWEDHVRFAITAEEWNERRVAFLEGWVS